MPYVVIEGVDGTGKSSLVTKSFAGRDDVARVKQPGTTLLGDKIHEILHSPDYKVSGITYQVLCAVAAASAENMIDELRDAYRFVISDRWQYTSCYAYGRASGLSKPNIHKVHQLFHLSAPDLIVLLQTDDVGGSLERSRVTDEGVNYVEEAGVNHLKRVQDEYLDMAKRQMFCPRWHVIDVTSQNWEYVQQEFEYVLQTLAIDMDSVKA